MQEDVRTIRAKLAELLAPYVRGSKVDWAIVPAEVGVAGGVGAVTDGYAQCTDFLVE
jgi:hypothetical protein